MKRTVKTSLVLVIGLACGCKATPQIAGKWHGTSQMSATYSTTLSPKQRSQSVQTDFVLILTQNSGTVQGDVGVTAFKSSAYHVPIRAGVVQGDGKITLEADADATLNKTHFSFEGKVEGGSLSGRPPLDLTTSVGPLTARDLSPLLERADFMSIQRPVPRFDRDSG